MDSEDMRVPGDASRYCTSLFVPRRGDAEGARGTITFVEYRGGCYGITNQHVIASAEGQEFRLSLHGAVPLPGRLLMTSARDNPDLPLDIALFSLERDAIIRGGKEPYPLREDTGPVREGSSLLAVGYPGADPIYVTGTCIGASDRRIILHDGLSEDMRRTSFGGMSGGPIFALEEDGIFKLVGIIYQGRGLGDGAEDVWIYGFPVNRDLMEVVLRLPDT